MSALDAESTEPDSGETPAADAPADPESTDDEQAPAAPDGEEEGNDEASEPPAAEEEGDAPEGTSATATTEGVKASAAAEAPVYRVLVVEDSPPLRRMIEKLLSSDGFEVTVANNGQEALQELKQAEAPYSLMLLDIMMPVMDGIKLMAHIKKDPPPNPPPVVLCSSRSDRETVQLTQKLGAAGYILKPFKTETVLTKVRSALDLPEQDE